ncbi:MAG: Hsp20/alpha crystallin family protein [Candidatus Acidiferrales bacterium]
MFNITEPQTFFRDLFDFRRDFDEIFNHLTLGWPVANEPKLLTTGFVPTAESWIDPETKKFFLRIAIPGVEPKDVKIELHGDMLTITGERKFFETKKELNYMHHEFAYGTFERVITLPEGVDLEKLYAEFNNGMLMLNAPMAAAALPRRIEIKPLLKKAA